MGKSYVFNNKKIVIYGAGKFAMALAAYAQTQKCHVLAFVVSHTKFRKLHGIPVYDIHDLPEGLNQSELFLGLKSEYHEEVFSAIKDAGFQQVQIIDDDDLEAFYVKQSEPSKEFLMALNKEGKHKKVNEIKNILIIRLDGIGDVILSFPFFRELRKNFPHSFITLLVGPAVYDLVENCPYFNKVLSFQWQGYSAMPFLWQLEMAKKYLENIFGEKKFDLSIVPRFDVDYYGATVLSYCSGAPWRIAYSEKVRPLKSKINKNFDALSTDILSTDDVKHEVLRGLDIIHYLGGIVFDDTLKYWGTIDDLSNIKSLFDRECTGAKKFFLAVGIGASSPAKTWPVGKFIEVISLLYKENPHICFVLVGGKDEIFFAENIRMALPQISCINLVNRVTLRQLGAAFRYVDVYFGNDTGPMHLAAACGCKIVEISRMPQNGDISLAASDYRFGPWKVPNVIIRPKCGQVINEEYPDTIQTIEPQQVYEAVKMFLGVDECL